MDKCKNLLKEYWLVLLICSQPFLDVLAFWTRSEKGTVSGYLRLAVLAVLCLTVLCRMFRRREDRRFLPAVCGVALIFLLHVFSCWKHGYLGFVSDTRMLVSVLSLPVMAICLCCLMDSEKLCRQAVGALLFNFCAEASFILLSYITGTYTHTYPEGIGISGWVIQECRCCHSDILTSVCVFAAYLSVVSKKKWINISVPVACFVLLITNGTTVSYVTLFAVCAGFPAFLLIRAMIRKEKTDTSQRIVSGVMAVLFALAVIVFPYTPRNKMDEIKRSFFDRREEEFAAEMDKLGYNVYEMTLDDIFGDETAHQHFIDYYKRYVFGEVDPLGRRFSFDRIITAYNGTVDGDVLGDARDMKNVYVRFIFEDSDFLTRLSGIEYDSIGPEKANDLENDWYAILYYLGYFGFALAVLAVLFLLCRILCLLIRKKKDALTDLNFTLLIGFCMQLGMGYFSGAIMRRPNASVYVAVFAAMIFFRTRTERDAETGKGKNPEACDI